MQYVYLFYTVYCGVVIGYFKKLKINESHF